jgi:hypothetical protein
MHDDELRNVFAALAMVALVVREGSTLDTAQQAYILADEMMDAKEEQEEQQGIVAVKPVKRRVRK